MGKLREWDKDHDREARELRGQLAKSDLKKLSSGSFDEEEEDEDGHGGGGGGSGYKKKHAGTKEWKNKLRGGGDAGLITRELGYSIGD